MTFVCGRGTDEDAQLRGEFDVGEVGKDQICAKPHSLEVALCCVLFLDQCSTRIDPVTVGMCFEVDDAGADRATGWARTDVQSNALIDSISVAPDPNR
jgi:hypothetical protein